MQSWDINRSGEMEVFVRVVEQGGFSAAARICQLTPSAISKLVSRLEARLGTRLVNRSTRRLQLTPEGSNFYAQAVRILADITEAERIAASGEQPSGHIRLNTSSAFGTHILTPLVPEFLACYPEVSLEIALTDAIVDLMAERVDVAVRAGPLKSSSLIARNLGSTRMVIVGAPDYLARVGMPQSVADLEQCNRLGFAYSRAVKGWPLLQDGEVLSLSTVGRVQASDGEALRQLALAGAGLARLAEFMVRDDLAAGRLLPVMEACNPGDRESFFAVYLGQGGPLPARVRALLDFLAGRVRIG